MVSSPCPKCGKQIFNLFLHDPFFEMGAVREIDAEPCPWGGIRILNAGEAEYLPDAVSDTDEPLYRFHDEVCGLPRTHVEYQGY